MSFDKSKPFAFAVVDQSQGGTHVDDEPYGTRKAALDRANELNKKKGTTRYEVKPLFAE